VEPEQARLPFDRHVASWHLRSSLFASLITPPVVAASPPAAMQRPWGPTAVQTTSTSSRGRGEIRIVERANSHEDQMRPGLGFAKEWGPARPTESPVHLVATVGDTSIVARLSGHCEVLAAETRIDRSAASTEILTVPELTHACHDRRVRALPVNCSARHRPVIGIAHSEQRGANRWIREQSRHRVRNSANGDS